MKISKAGLLKNMNGKKVKCTSKAQFCVEDKDLMKASLEEGLKELKEKHPKVKFEVVEDGPEGEKNKFVISADGVKQNQFWLFPKTFRESFATVELRSKDFILHYEHGADVYCEIKNFTVLTETQLASKNTSIELI